MKTPIQLTRSVTLEGWRVAGQIAFAAKREWEPAVLRLAVDHGGVSPSTVAQELLGGRDPVARRLVDVCEKLGLLERTGDVWVATSAGGRAAASGVILVPERGAWTLWPAEDPLLEAVVCVELWREPTGQQAVAENRLFESLPGGLLAAKNQEFVPLFCDHGCLRIDDLGGGRGERSAAMMELRLVVNLEPSSVRATALHEAAGKTLVEPLRSPDLDYEAAWRSLAGQAGLLDAWDMGKRSLAVGFDELSDTERAALCRNVELSAPALPGLGRFDATTVRDVPIHPRSKSDAAAWAEWRLVHGITTYVTGDGLARLHREASAAFGELAPPQPERAALAQKLRGTDRPTPVYWHLQAPSDWTLTDEVAR